MGNTVVKLTPCLAGSNADENAPQSLTHYQTPTTAIIPNSFEEGIGQTISFKRDATQQNSDDPNTVPFQTIHCVSLGANQLTPSSIMNNDYSFSSSSSFDRSSSFSSFALHPYSSSFSSSDPSYSGILVRSDSKTFFQEIQAARDRRNQEKLENPSILHRLKSAVSSRIKKYTGGLACGSHTSTVQGACDEGKSDLGAVHWAQGKAGEDRVQLVYSEEHQLLFVGIYDGFYGPDAADFLLANLYESILLELEGIQWEKQDHQLVLGAMSRALKRADEEYLGMADRNPELALVGSCVLVMLMKGEDLYLMNVGDSRAVLAQKAPEPDLSTVLGKADEDLERFKVEMMRQLEAYERDKLSGLVAAQLTMDHSTAIYQVINH